MLDLSIPESKIIIEACFLIDNLSKSYKDIVSLGAVQRKTLFGANRFKLGHLGLLADRILSPDKRELANHNIKLLYKALTGQIEITEKDFEKIENLLSELDRDCFACWCI